MTRAFRTTARAGFSAAVCSMALFAAGSLTACASARTRPTTVVTRGDSSGVDGDSLATNADSLATRRHGSSFADPTSAIEGDAVRSQRVTRVADMLVGRFPGVSVMHTANGGTSIQIRGQNTILGSTEPLIVIDGMILPVGSGGLDAVNPNDVERIEVLRRIDETAFYGVRGSNGVILITTRRR